MKGHRRDFFYDPPSPVFVEFKLSFSHCFKLFESLRPHPWIFSQTTSVPANYFSSAGKGPFLTSKKKICTTGALSSGVG